MPFFRIALARHSAPAAHRRSCRRCSSSIRAPPESAPRICPTPLLFVSAKGWDAESHKGSSLISNIKVDTLAATLSIKGFTCLHYDLSPSSSSHLDSTAIMHHFVSHLKSEIRLSGHISFPPVIFARSFASLIAQTYISSNPATAMMLMGNIPSTNVEVPKQLLPTPLEEFNYEPKFPIAILTTLHEAERLRATNRLTKDPSVDLFVVRDMESQEAFSQIEGWLDDLGI
ncbi:hypothetical protein B0H10DRAFT_2161316 [Mycena sp. CBHHK59/15]|nr:hypothetical protein B0H10DRAFT_2161316 [Mycena sp. CBHHK59/15]